MSKIIESLKYLIAIFQVRTNYLKYFYAVILYRFKRKNKFPKAVLKLKGTTFLTRENSMDIAHLSNLYEPQTTKFLLKTKINNFIDVGAHVGRFSIILAKKGTNVISIEPSKENFNQLTKNIKNDILSTLKCGVSIS